MKKIAAIILSISLLAVLFSSCTLFSKSLDEKKGLTRYLDQVESSIRGDDWTEALTGQEKAFKAWRSVKPILQIDVDHDYVNLIEQYFISLKAYIETQAKSDALATVMLIKDTWGNIGIM